jgi:hypothetical protein
LKRQTLPAVSRRITTSWRKSQALPWQQSRAPSFTAALITLKAVHMRTRIWHVWFSLLSAASVCVIAFAGAKAAEINDYPAIFDVAVKLTQS